MSLSLYDTIRSTSGLIAYWPLVDTADHSGNGRNLVSVGAPSFGLAPMTTDFRPSVQNAQSGVALRARQDTLPKIVAMEGWFRLAGAKVGEYSTVLGVSQPLSGYDKRYILVYHSTLGFCSYQNFYGQDNVVTYKSDLTWESLSVGSHHFVLQFDSVSSTTQVYIDGVLAAGMTVPFDIFQQTANTYLALGAFYFMGDARGCSQLSDVAAYSRVLTPAEIAQRQAFTLRTFNPDVKPGSAPAPRWAIPLTREQAWPGENHSAVVMAYGPSLVAPVTQVPHLSTPPTRAELGYISGVVTVKQTPAPGRIVRCFDPTMTLVGQTVSDAAGNYRFDNLLRNRMYLVLAQDNEKFDYSPASADRRKPEAYAA